MTIKHKISAIFALAVAAMLLSWTGDSTQMINGRTKADMGHQALYFMIGGSALGIVMRRTNA